MTQETVLLPDALALRARNAGLLSDAAIRQILEAAMRREAGRELMRLADDIREARIAPISDEENVAEVKAHRAERRADRRLERRHLKAARPPAHRHRAHRYLGADRLPTARPPETYPTEKTA